MKTPRKQASPRGPRHPAKGAMPHSTRSAAATRAHARKPKKSIIEEMAWIQIQADKKAEEDANRQHLSSTQLSTAVFKVAGLPTATLTSAASPDDPRAENLTNFPSAGEGFLPPAPR